MERLGTALVVGVAAVFASSATGQVLSTSHTIVLPQLEAGATVAPRDATGDTYDTAVTAFSTGGGAFLHDPALRTQTFPATDASLGATVGAGRTLRHTSSVTVVGNVETYVFEWTTNDGAPMFGSGVTVAGAPITVLSFEIGENNAGSNTVDPMSAFVFNHLEDDEVPGTFLAQFELFDDSGTDLFGGGGNFFVTNTGSGFSGIVQVNAGGANLGNFGIVSGRATISITVPAPASFGLCAVAGVVALRRRR